MRQGEAGGLLVRRLLLEPVPESARVARHALADTLTEAGCADLTDTATLLVSELVTNAVLHARTGIEVVVTASPAGLRVGVNDRSHHLPARRDYGRGATTGRGLELLDLVAAAHGTDVHEDGTKTVWFSLGTAPCEGTDEPDPEAAQAAPARVVLRDVPLAVAHAWQQHADALLRELLLAAWESPETAGDVGELTAACDAFTEVAVALDEAFATGAAADRADVALTLPGRSAEGFSALDRVLEAGADLTDRGLLLAPKATPSLRGFRRWLCTQVREQLADAAPTPRR